RHRSRARRGSPPSGNRNSRPARAAPRRANRETSRASLTRSPDRPRGEIVSLAQRRGKGRPKSEDQGNHSRSNAPSHQTPKHIKRPRPSNAQIQWIGHGLTPIEPRQTLGAAQDEPYRAGEEHQPAHQHPERQSAHQRVEEADPEGADLVAEMRLEPR